MSIFFGGAASAHADVVINEIAWMGTTVSVNDEWIELLNNGDTSVSLDGWKLKAADGSPIITLQGNIPANGYLVLERTDDTTVPNVTAAVIYSGALGNEGETLVLQNATGQSVDTVDMTSGWVAGNATTKETMQRSGNNWITGTSTPAAQNVSTPVDTGNDTDPSDDSDPDDTTDGTDTPSTTNNSTRDKVIKIEPNPIYAATMLTPDIFIQQVPLEFGSLVKKDGVLESLRGRFEWSMGDGGSFVFPKSTSFNYTYQEPGQYVIMLRYYSNIFKEQPDTIHKKTITVLPATISIDTNSLGTIILNNNSGDDIDLGGWILQSNESSFTFPKYTILQKGSQLKIPQSVHGLSNKNITLLTPNGFLASQKKQKNNYPVLGNTPTKVTNASSDNEDFTGLYAVADESITKAPIEFKKVSQSVIIWIGLFIGLLILATIGLHVVTRKLESESEKTEN